MRTIKNSLFQRLVAQAEEADRQELYKVADSLTEQAVKNSTALRADDEFYVYSAEDFQADVNNQLWNAIVRIADFYDIHQFNADQVQTAVENAAESLIQELCAQANITHGVGAFEEAVPGEITGRVALEVEEE